MESESRELVPGIFIHKNYISSSSIPSAIATYIWNIEVKTMSVITLNLSFENSENIKIENNKNSEISIIINPFENKEIVKITLFNDWILNPKFQLKLNVPSKKLQESFIKKEKNEINQNLKKSKILKNYQLENFSIKEIEKLFTENKIEKFVDYDFPPNDLSMISKKFSKDGTEIKDILDYIIDWRRPENFILLNDEKNNVYNIINDNPEANDIIQEILPDHNFSSAISCIAERPNLIRKLFNNNNNVSKYGFYIINLCINGKWKKICIDDLFPCIPKSNPMITHSPSNEIYILLLEKSLAKIFDSYYDLLYIEKCDFLLYLTGCPSFYFLTEELIRNGIHEFYNKIYDYVINKKYLVMAIKKINEDIDDSNNNNLNNSFIVNDFGYTILDIVDKGSIKFLLLRKVIFQQEKEEIIENYHNQILNKFPDLKNILIPGTIIFSLEDFIKEFTNINVCYVKNWEENRIKGLFILSNEYNKDNNNNKIENNNLNININNNKRINIISKYYYLFELKENSNIIISLFQDEDKLKQNESRKPLMDISLTILKYDKNTNEINHIQTIDFSITPSIQMELNLSSGNYIIFPRTSGCFIGKINDNFSMRNTYLKNENGELNKIFINVIKDIFERYDFYQNNILNFEEFNNLIEKMYNSKVNENEVNDLIQKYSFNQKGISEKGLIKFFSDILSKDENLMRNYLKNLGYDNDLYCNKYRNFMIVIHSNNPLTVNLKETLNSGINEKVNKILLKHFGEAKKNNINENVNIILLRSKLNESIITLGCKNNNLNKLKVTIGIKNLNGLIFGISNENTKIINGNDLEYFFQFYIQNPNELENIDFTIKTSPI